MSLPVLDEERSERARADVGPDSPPSALIPWVFRRFDGQNIVVSTQFGMEGCALVDMCWRQGCYPTVVYLDTKFFFAETYALRDAMRRRYPEIRFINRGTDLTPEEQEQRHGPELWRTNPDLCCRLRKVEPMRRAMADADVWITALRRSQSATRANLQTIEWDWKFQVLKVNPLAAWSRKDVWDYIQQHDVPYNALHERGYPTVGCTHCTKPVDGASVTDYSRAGRWDGSSKTECGLHGGGI